MKDSRGVIPVSEETTSETIPAADRGVREAASAASLGNSTASPAPCVFVRMASEVRDSTPGNDTAAPGYESRHRCCNSVESMSQR